MESIGDYFFDRCGEFPDALGEFPRFFEIETVNACNARCPMCTIDDWDRKDGLMHPDLFAKIAQELGAHAKEVRRVHLYRDGEPLLDKRIAGKVAHLKALKIQRVGLSTNAALLTTDRAEMLLMAGLDEIILSVDSLDKATYEAIRVGLDFDEVMRNCLQFIRLRDDMQSSCQIWVRMIRQESNKDEWPAFKAFWSGKVRESDRVDYRNIHNWGSQLVNFKPVAEANIADPCIAPWSLMVIFADGSVPRCNVDYNNKHPIGNVGESTIKELWKSAPQIALRLQHLAGNRGGICVGCNVWSEGANSKAERKAA